jgi:hypothetical protein
MKIANLRVKAADAFQSIIPISPLMGLLCQRDFRSIGRMYYYQPKIGELFTTSILAMLRPKTPYQTASPAGKGTILNVGGLI